MFGLEDAVFSEILSTMQQSCPRIRNRIWSNAIAILVCLGLLVEPALSEANHFALIVSGASGDEEFREKFWKWSTQLVAILQTELRFPRDHVSFLTEDPERALEQEGLKATKIQLHESLDRLRQQLKKEDLVLILLLGHASYDGGEYKFNLVGPDITGSELKSWLEPFSSHQLVLIVATPCSGILVKQLADRNRILITATKSEFETNNIIFPEFLVEALKQRNADSDKNSRVSILEAFRYASQMTASWYKGQGLLATEHPLIEDTGNQSAVSDLSPANGDGLLAARIYLDYPVHAADPEKPKATVNPEVEFLRERRRQVEESIQRLKYQKSTLAETEYVRQLEDLLIQLAQTNQKLRQAEKKNDYP